MIKIENLIVAFFGFTTVLLFILLVNLGTILDINNSYVFREVSYFISPYMSGRLVTIPFFQLYNIMLLLFAIGLWIRLKDYYAKLGAVSLAFSAIVGISLILFPQDNPLMPQTIAGYSHIFVVSLMSFFSVASMMLFGTAFKSNVNLTWLSKYSYSISTVLLLGTVVTGILAFYDRTIVGFVEKLPIGAFLFWILLVAVGMLTSDRRVKYLSIDMTSKQIKKLLKICFFMFITFFIAFITLVYIFKIL